MARLPKVEPASPANVKPAAPSKPAKAAMAEPAKTAVPKPSLKIRTLWTGTLKLALVTVPVAIVSATETASRFTFHQVHEPSGRRVKQEKVVPGIDGAIEAGDIRKGYEVEKGRYLLFKNEEIDELKVEGERVLDITQSVGADDVDPVWFEKPYYLIPASEDAREPYAVIREALRNTKRVAIGQFVMRGRDYVAAIKPYHNGLVIETLRSAGEVKNAAEIFGAEPAKKPARELVDLASQILVDKAAPYDPGAFVDRYEDALRKLIDRRQRGEEVVDVLDVERGDPGEKVIDLAEALTRSIASARAAKAGPKLRRTG